MEYSIPLINNLKIKGLFKNKNKKKGIGVMDLINKRPIKVKSKINGQLKRYFNTIKQIVKYITKFSRISIKKLYKN